MLKIRKKMASDNTFSTWNANKWRPIVFSDECIIKSSSSKWKLRIRRKSAERDNSAILPISYAARFADTCLGTTVLKNAKALFHPYQKV